MRQLHREQPSQRPVRFLQFGQGNFLRGFVDWQIDLLNERCGLDADVVIVRPTTRSTGPLLDTQGGVYTTLVRGLNEAGEAVKEYRKITCVQREIDLRTMVDDFLALARNLDIRFVVSNTTEAGIAVNDTDRFEDRPPQTFPAKLTRWLHERFVHFKGSRESGLVFLPCELIDNNGPALKAAVLHYARLWDLAPDFAAWIEGACTFCSTLVDRIVTGYPKEEIAAIEAETGCRDDFLVAAEYYTLFVIEGPASLADELKLAGSGLNIQLVDDIKPYKQRKVGVLNGGHTTMVPVALLAGLSSVGEAMKDAEVQGFLVDALHKEIIPALPLPREDLEAFAGDVLRRFANPYIHHRLESIALNSWAKFAARVIPQLLNYQRSHNALPQRLVLALAATVHVYRGSLIKLGDDAGNLAWFAEAWTRIDQGQWGWPELAQAVLARQAIWGRNLNEVPGLGEALAAALGHIARDGMRSALRSLQVETTA